MDEYVAIVRVRPLARDGSLPGLTKAAHACQSEIGGVSEAVVDTGALQLRFDRSQASVADIVRFLEDFGLTVTAVAQSKVDARMQAASA